MKYQASQWHYLQNKHNVHKYFQDLYGVYGYLSSSITLNSQIYVWIRSP